MTVFAPNKSFIISAGTLFAYPPSTRTCNRPASSFAFLDDDAGASNLSYKGGKKPTKVIEARTYRHNVPFLCVMDLEEIKSKVTQ